MDIKINAILNLTESFNSDSDEAVGEFKVSRDTL